MKKTSNSRNIYEIITIYRKMKKGRGQNVFKKESSEEEKLYRNNIYNDLKKTQFDLSEFEHESEEKSVKLTVEDGISAYKKDNNSKFEINHKNIQSNSNGFRNRKGVEYKKYYDFQKYDFLEQEKFLFYSKSTGIQQFNEIENFSDFYQKCEKSDLVNKQHLSEFKKASNLRENITEESDLENYIHRNTDQSDFEYTISKNADSVDFINSSQNREKERKNKFWLNVFDPSSHDLNMLGNLFNIHDMTLADIKERDTREKIEVFHNYTFISIRLYSSTDAENGDTLKLRNLEVGKLKNYYEYKKKIENKKYTFSETDFTLKNKSNDIDFNILLFSDKIITLHDSPWSGISDILNFTDLLVNYTSLHPEWVLFSILVEFLQDIRYLVDKIGPRVVEMQSTICNSNNFNGDSFDHIFTDPYSNKIQTNKRYGNSYEKQISSNKNISNILQENFFLTNRLYSLKHSTKPKTNILNHLTVKHKKKIKKNVLKHIAYIYEDFILLDKEVRENRKSLERCQDLLLGLVNMAQSTESIDLNRLMKTFTLITLIFLPLQTVSGIWGMNVLVPFQKMNSLWPFWFLTGIGPLMSAIYFFWLKKSKNNSLTMH